MERNERPEPSPEVAEIRPESKESRETPAMSLGDFMEKTEDEVVQFALKGKEGLGQNAEGPALEELEHKTDEAIQATVESWKDLAASLEKEEPYRPATQSPSMAKAVAIATALSLAIPAAAKAYRNPKAREIASYASSAGVTKLERDVRKALRPVEATVDKEAMRKMSLAELKLTSEFNEAGTSPEEREKAIERFRELSDSYRERGEELNDQELVATILAEMASPNTENDPYNHKALLTDFLNSDEYKAYGKHKKVGPGNCEARTSYVTSMVADVRPSVRTSVQFFSDHVQAVVWLDHGDGEQKPYVADGFLRPLSDGEREGSVMADASVVRDAALGERPDGSKFEQQGKQEQPDDPRFNMTDAPDGARLKPPAGMLPTKSFSAEKQRWAEEKQERQTEQERQELARERDAKEDIEDQANAINVELLHAKTEAEKNKDRELNETLAKIKASDNKIEVLRLAYERPGVTGRELKAENVPEHISILKLGSTVEDLSWLKYSEVKVIQAQESNSGQLLSTMPPEAAAKVRGLRVRDTGEMDIIRRNFTSLEHLVIDQGISMRDEADLEVLFNRGVTEIQIGDWDSEGKPAGYRKWESTETSRAIKAHADKWQADHKGVQVEDE